MYNDPEDHPRISDKERCYIEDTKRAAKRLDKDKVKENVSITLNVLYKQLELYNLKFNILLGNYW